MVLAAGSRLRWTDIVIVIVLVIVIVIVIRGLGGGASLHFYPSMHGREYSLEGHTICCWFDLDQCFLWAQRMQRQRPTLYARHLPTL